MEELVEILKQLQLISMSIDTDLPEEDNVAGLISALHWAETQILAAHQAEMDRVVEVTDDDGRTVEIFVQTPIKISKEEYIALAKEARTIVDPEVV